MIIFLQVSPDLYGDKNPRFFTYWTVSIVYSLFLLNIRTIITSADIFSIQSQTDAYQATGCYNLLCSGFVQTNNRVAIGAAISPKSYYNGRQFDIGLMVWKVSLSFNQLTDNVTSVSFEQNP